MERVCSRIQRLELIYERTLLWSGPCIDRIDLGDDVAVAGMPYSSTVSKLLHGVMTKPWNVEDAAPRSTAIFFDASKMESWSKLSYLATVHVLEYSTRRRHSLVCSGTRHAASRRVREIANRAAHPYNFYLFKSSIAITIPTAWHSV